MNRKPLRTLLLQIRDDERVRREEHTSFARYSGLSLDQIDIHNVFEKPEFPKDIVDGYDALFVGGASEASVLEPERYRFVKDSIELLLYCIKQDIPVFASCFGFQLAVLALGGEITHDGENYEMGTIPIHVSGAGKQDPLYCDVPDPFLAVSVHQQKTENVPPSCTELAFTESCCHSFKVNKARFWAFQFHPEVDRQTLVERLTIYRKKYTRDVAHLDSVLSAAEETPYSNGLLRSFVDRVLLDT